MNAPVIGAHVSTGVPWLTPTVLSLAQAAYDERPRRGCVRCGGHGYDLLRTNGPKCPECHGTGRVEDGALDPLRLMVLADALEEAGCTDEAILRHLRGWEMCACEVERVYGVPMSRPKVGAQTLTCLACDDGWRKLRGPYVRGCWSLDLLLGKG